MTTSQKVRLTAIGFGLGILASAAAVKLGATAEMLLLAGMFLAIVV